MRYKSYNSPFSLISILVGLFLLIYLWLPLFIIVFIGLVIFVVINYIIAKFTGNSSNVNVKIIRIRPTQTNKKHDSSKPIDYIDSTTADKD